LANRFETRLCGFLDLAVSVRKKPKSHLDKVDQIINWKPIEGFLQKKLRGDPQFLDRLAAFLRWKASVFMPPLRWSMR
jgi:hypothetical protein